MQPNFFFQWNKLLTNKQVHICIIYKYINTHLRSWGIKQRFFCLRVPTLPAVCPGLGQGYLPGNSNSHPVLKCYLLHWSGSFLTSLFYPLTWPCPYPYSTYHISLKSRQHWYELNKFHWLNGIFFTILLSLVAFCIRLRFKE